MNIVQNEILDDVFHKLSTITFVMVFTVNTDIFHYLTNVPKEHQDCDNKMKVNQ